MLIKFSKTSKESFSSNNSVIISIATGLLKIPAHPHEDNLFSSICGALSVPRKKFFLPLVAAFNNASLSSLFFKIG